MGIKRVAVIGLGPSGAITIDALAREQAFDRIRVFERREAPGGCWLEDSIPPTPIPASSLPALASRTADTPIPLPASLPAKTEKSTRQRYTESSVYPYLETNVHHVAMSFSQEPLQGEPTALSVSKHGPQSPFLHHSIVQRWVQGLVRRRGYEAHVSYGTSVELAEKVAEEWRLVLRRDGAGEDEWWEEWFDAVVVASGHYSVPYIPRIPGLQDVQRARPGSVKHSKMFRGREGYKGKKVLIVGASVSAADIAIDLLSVAQTPIPAVVLGHKPNVYFGATAFQHPLILQKPSLSHFSLAKDKAITAHFTDRTSIPNIDDIIFGTGYTWTLPFLPSVKVRNNRIPGLYQHVVYTPDPSLLFVGAVAPGLTFRIFEWQAVLCARILSGRCILPPASEQRRWEEERVRATGDGPAFTLIYPQFEAYFEAVRELAGEAGPGRKLPRFERGWVEVMMRGHEMRKRWWGEMNEKAREELDGKEGDETDLTHNAAPRPQQELEQVRSRL